jgi:hypothetical protein
MKRAALSMLVLVACGGGERPGPAESAGGESAAPDDATLSIAGIDLPPLPHGVRLDRPPLEEGVGLARRTGDHELPQLLETATRAEVDAWVRGPLHDWMLERGRGLREARLALAEAERDDAEDGERAVAAAVLGVLYLRFALDLAELPLPESVRADAAARLGIRNALLQAASPLLDGAQSAFGACSVAAVQSTDPSLEPWERFCDENAVEAQEAPRPIDDGSVERRATEAAEPEAGAAE